MMKKNPTDRMKDPAYAQLLLAIEQMICYADDQAQKMDMDLTDSQIRSALIKARKLVQGLDPDVPQSTEREQVLGSLIMAIYHAPDDLVESVTLSDGSTEEQLVEIGRWLNAIETVLDSVKTRTHGPGSRGYLSYIHGFVRKALDES